MKIKFYHIDLLNFTLHISRRYRYEFFIFEDKGSLGELITSDFALTSSEAIRKARQVASYWCEKDVVQISYHVIEYDREGKASTLKSGMYKPLTTIRAVHF